MTEARNIIEPVSFRNDGEMELLDVKPDKDGKEIVKEYIYFGITWDIKEHVLRLGLRKQRGKIYQLLEGFSCIEKWEWLEANKEANCNV